MPDPTCRPRRRVDSSCSGSGFKSRRRCALYLHAHCVDPGAVPPRPRRRDRRGWRLRSLRPSRCRAIGSPFRRQAAIRPGAASSTSGGAGSTGRGFRHGRQRLRQVEMEQRLRGSLAESALLGVAKLAQRRSAVDSRHSVDHIPVMVSPISISTLMGMRLATAPAPGRPNQ